ncbi:reactive intermediate/imine deaminase [Candidatus Atribacteria bacterium RBG_19FT_COMBO_35_14]|uniref:Reactive intermediate/imine deaminase n=1 Tax=Candidatus Sediminicultor quintus TaxID=1797291 RepID=A0A1F5AEY4_9BACT|nr:MAG: reactive intermediate/imine deaminase [Candidatus Atribacteria bacterium RBG_19FT_COMBO_35_14]OGD35734.1 MAG: reactive intermediate/imine deaminase [Candidatus Atribacteria bacterium RBG_16_35_8]
MEERIIISSNKIPAAIGPYSPAVKVGSMLFLSGQLPINSETGNIVGGNIQEQTKQILENLKILVELYSCTLKNIVKTTVFLKDMNDFTKFNQIYAEYFEEKFPARSCVEVACLPKNALIEIEAIAMQ